MTKRYSITATLERLQETEQAIARQKSYAATLTDPALIAIAARTLDTLEDMRGIIARTHGILVGDIAGDGATTH